ncbi:hypothetical protein FRX31_033338, partial [Thalictrum thalictroides]
SQPSTTADVLSKWIELRWTIPIPTTKSPNVLDIVSTPNSPSRSATVSTSVSDVPSLDSIVAAPLDVVPTSTNVAPLDFTVAPHINHVPTDANESSSPPPPEPAIKSRHPMVTRLQDGTRRPK